jgi:hypothetical protein
MTHTMNKAQLRQAASAGTLELPYPVTFWDRLHPDDFTCYGTARILPSGCPARVIRSTRNAALLAVSPAAGRPARFAWIHADAQIPR